VITSATEQENVWTRHDMPATGRFDRLPNVERRQNGTVKQLEEADLSLCRLCRLGTYVKFVNGAGEVYVTTTGSLEHFR